ncbi:Run domain Beclin-1-interacting and cysteine-rich domain-containing protein [Nymphon striatum]|nr:Run domain Beclin-1-interacting and cysteine-rich domain-containing protein [Nymphon striatum]
MMSAESECHQLLLGLKSTVEGLLANQSSNVWNTYGGLNRLSAQIEKTLNHKLRISQGITNFWHFVHALKRLQPILAPFFNSLDKTYGSDIQMISINWLHHNLYSLSLSSKLKILLDDKEHLAACYEEGAFLRDPDYASSLLTCLLAVEQNRPALLAELDPSILIRHRKSRFTQEADSNQSLSAAIHDVKSFSSTSAPQQSLNVDPLMNLDCDSISVPKLNKFKLLKSYSCDYSNTKHESWFKRKTKFRFRKRVRSLEESQINDKCDEEISPYKPAAEQSSLSLSDVKVEILDDSYENENSYFSSKDLHQLLKSTKYDSAAADETEQTPNCEEMSSYNVHDSADYFIPPKQQPNEAGKLSENVNSEEIKKNLKHINPLKEERLLNRSKSSEPEKSRKSAVGSNSALKTSPVISIPKKGTHIRSRSDIITNNDELSKILCDEVDGVAEIKSKSLSSSLPSKKRRGSLLEEGSKCVVPKTECFFPQPAEGQSLTSFLSSQDFNTCVEVDRENAHFSISEALIGAIAEIKWNQSISNAILEDSEESDEEIVNLKQRIRIRRRERQLEVIFFRYFQVNQLATTTNASPNSSTSSHCSDLADTSDDVDDLEYSDNEKSQSKLSSLNETGLSLSMASLYSDADVQRMQLSASGNMSSPSIEQTNISSLQNEDTSSVLSAESIALSLLKKFSSKQLPKASDLEWLVSEQDVPQRLLPLPNSLPVSPDDLKPTRLRGNKEWAPPRAQIIFNVHPNPNRKHVMEKQNYRCAGCGMKTEKSYIKRFRYCEYLGKYFCQCCHNNDVSVIPSKVLHKWDFNKYHVSKFSSDLLEKMWFDPLFNIIDINSVLYKKIKALDALRKMRLQLYYIKDFLHTCRYCKDLQSDLSMFPLYLITDPDQYTMHDLVQVKSGDLLARMKNIVNLSIKHVKDCSLCQAKGFICEICNKDSDVIFPFQIKQVIRCSKCCSCFHKSCYVPEKCPKCARIELRKKREKDVDFSTEVKEIITN